MQEAKKFFPNATHVTHADASKYRIAQLVKRGHTHEEIRRIELEKFVKNLRQKRAQDLLKARSAKKQSKPHHP